MTETTHHGARQLIVCCDGTNNTLTAGLNDTNVVKLTRMLAPAHQHQRLYYDPGVGVADTLPSVDRVQAIRRTWSRIEGLASGRGVFENIGKAYRFLAEEYQEGDEIYLFGFSRGAFTARAVAGMVNLFGLIQPHNIDLLDMLVYTYFSRAGDVPPEAHKRTRREVADDIRDRFAGAGRDQVDIHFLGVWDTVASVGMPGLRQKVTSDGLTSTKRYRHVRHALARNETRWTFLPRLFWEQDYDASHHPKGHSLKQRWFSGVHADIGGGYAFEHGADAAGLSDHALRWMVDEAVQCGLRLKAGEAPPSVSPQIALMHCEPLSTPWWAIGGLVERERALPPDEAKRMAAFVRDEQLLPYRTNDDDLMKPQQYIEPWQAPRPWQGLTRCLCAMLCFYLLTALYASAAMHGSLPASWSEFSLDALVAGGVQFDAWQRHLLTAPSSGAAAVMPAYAAWSIIFDFGLIGAYSWLLGFIAVRVFERVRHMAPGSHLRPPLLFMVGWLPCLTVVADLTENLATLVTLASQALLFPVLPWIAQAVMAIANIVKWIALAGAVLGFGLGALTLSPPAADSEPSNA